MVENGDFDLILYGCRKLGKKAHFLNVFELGYFKYY